MLPDSSDVDAAVIAALRADAALATLAPDGVWWDVPPQAAQRFVIVSLVISQDLAAFGPASERRIREQILYLVKSVLPGADGTSSKAAALRIDRVLEDQPLTITGFEHLATYRTERVRATEPDPIDPSTRWQHRGGRYRVEVAPIYGG